MYNIINILDGWKNFMDKSEVTEDLARKRAAHCAKCPKAKKGKLTAFLNDDLVEIQGYRCTICHCPLSAKLRSKLETCPLKKW